MNIVSSMLHERILGRQSAQEILIPRLLPRDKRVEWALALMLVEPLNRMRFLVHF
jgi:hypothetical protein